MRFPFDLARLKRISTDLKAIDTVIAELIAADETLSAQHPILLSIPGISTVTAAALMAQMPELGALDQRAAASLAGLAPMTRQSGQLRGEAFIQGGRALVRDALYAVQPLPEGVQDRLVAAGKTPKVAIVAVMRKLLVFANALLRDQRKWTPTLA